MAAERRLLDKARDCRAISRFSRREFLCLLGVLAQELESAFRLRGTAPHSRFRDCSMLPSERADAVGFPKP